VIQHSMITKSIERAQKKVEENNFGIRKRLLEYDDVMNKQRNVVYKKRNHALFGERLALDLDNAFYSVANGLVNSFKEANDHEGFKLAAIINFGIDTAITAAELDKDDPNVLSERLYAEAIMQYRRKTDGIAQQTMPIISNIRKEQGNHIENVAVPFTDGKKAIQALANLDKYLATQGRELNDALERSITLALIDDAWKEHLRAMDDLRHSVQTAGYEQKDPLVIYKIEAFNAFKVMDDQVNKDIVSFLCHAQIPMEQTNAGRIREGREQRTDMSKMRQRKEEYANAGEGPEYLSQENEYIDPSGPVKQEPIRVEKAPGRNDLCPCGSGKKYKHCHGKDL
ncbi:MAG TPA: SEC-C metal-binding domain-containing protein, partial [Ferruginibacter sp.]|nr:SEC-C metal-binding domain-containing protein [Ferruginibacter sp.]